MASTTTNGLAVLLLLLLLGLDPAVGQEREDAEKPAVRSPQSHAILVQNVGPGLIRNLHALLTKQHGVPAKHVAVFGSASDLKGLDPKAPTAANILETLTKLGEELRPGDQVLIFFLCHMRQGFLVNDQLPYARLNEGLAGFRRGVKVGVIIAGCHGGAALPVLDHADFVYAGARANEKTYGGFLHFLLDALGRKTEAFAAADENGNKDGTVTLGEAYDYAADEKRLADWYHALPEKVWPTDTVPVPERRTRRKQLDYETHLAAPPSSPRESDE